VSRFSIGRRRWRGCRAVSLPVGGGLEPEQHLGERRLAAAGFADDGQRLGLAGLEAERLVRLDHAGVAAEERARADLVVFLQVSIEQDDRVARHRRGSAGGAPGGRPPSRSRRSAGSASVGRGHRDHRDVGGVAAAGLEIAAARAEVAAARALVGQGEVAGDRDQRARVLVGARQRDRAEQALGIGVAHRSKTSSIGPVSTASPEYITQMRSQVSSTRPRLC
jgi:hypothetical protein